MEVQEEKANRLLLKKALNKGTLEFIRTLSSYTSIPSCATSILNMKISFYPFFPTP